MYKKIYPSIDEVNVVHLNQETQEQIAEINVDEENQNQFSLNNHGNVINTEDSNAINNTSNTDTNTNDNMDTNDNDNTDTNSNENTNDNMETNANDYDFATNDTNKR